MARPDPSEYVAHYESYVSLVPEEDILEAMRSELGRTVDFLTGVSDREASICHPPYTWTAKQVVGHLTDCERIFGYRALRIARGDSTPLPGFDENTYAQTAEFDQHPLTDLVAEFQTVRQSHLQSLSEPAPEAHGTCEEPPMAMESAFEGSPTSSSVTSDTMRPFCVSDCRARLHAPRGLPVNEIAMTHCA